MYNAMTILEVYTNQKQSKVCFSRFAANIQIIVQN